MHIDTNIKNETIEFLDKVQYNSIGSTSELYNCDIKINVPSRSIIILGKLTNCSISTKSQLSNFDWTQALLSGCKFKGKFKDNFFMFNGIPNFSPCDFSESNLDSCQFFGDQSKLNIYPKWPIIIIKDPSFNSNCLLESLPPEKLIPILNGLKRMNDKISIISINATALSKEYSIDTESIKGYFSKFDFCSL